MTGSPDPNYDLRTALDEFAPGIVPTREIDAGLAAQYQANGYTPLTEDQVLAVTGPLPSYPTGLPRFADSNPSPDGWSIGRSGGSVL